MEENQTAQQADSQVADTSQADVFNGLPIEEAKNRLAHYDIIKGEVEQYKAQQQISPFANDFVGKLNELAKQGASPDHILRFTQLQNVDISKIDAKAAIKLQYQMQNPALDGNEIDELIDYELGPVPDEELDPDGFAKAMRIRDVKAKMKAEESKKFLEGYKADLSTIKNPEVEQRRALETGWKQVIPSISSVEGIDVKVNLGKDLNYELPGFKPELDQSQLNAIQQVVLSNLVSQGVTLDENGMQIAKQMFNRSVETLAQRQLLEAVVKDAWASATQHVLQSLNTKR